MVFLRDNPIDDDVIFEEYFVATNPLTGEEIELIPNGRETRICDDNKLEYIQLMYKKLSFLLSNLFSKDLNGKAKNQ